MPAIALTDDAESMDFKRGTFLGEDGPMGSSGKAGQSEQEQQCAKRYKSSMHVPSALHYLY